MNALLKIALLPLLIVVGLWCFFEIVISKDKTTNTPSLTWKYDANANGDEIASNGASTAESISIVDDSQLMGSLSELSPASQSSSSFEPQTFVSTSQPDSQLESQSESPESDLLDGFSLEPPQSIAPRVSTPAKALVASPNAHSVRSLPPFSSDSDSQPPIPKVRLLPSSSETVQHTTAPESSGHQNQQPKLESISQMKVESNQHFGSMDRSSLTSQIVVEPKQVEAETLAVPEDTHVPELMAEESSSETSGGSFKPVQSVASSNNSDTRFGSNGNDSPDALLMPQLDSVQRPEPSLPVQRPLVRPQIAVTPQSRMMPTSPVVEQRANERIAYGKSLARRGSVYSARQEFTQALRILAESHDVSSQTRQYTSRLAAGLRALQEADDFVTSDTQQQLAMDVSMIVDAHSTKLLDSYEATNASPMAAMQRYYDFAARELAAAIGTSTVGADALQSLGKLLTSSVGSTAMDQTKAMVMHQAAMIVNPNNAKSSNELGVLMARNGRLGKAQELFKRSLQIEKSPEAWQNLGRVHQRFAQSDSNPQTRKEQLRLSQLAYRESEIWIERFGASGAQGPMEWVEPSEFNDKAAIAAIQGGPNVHTAPTARTAQANTESATKKSPGKGLLKDIKNWF